MHKRIFILLFLFTLGSSEIVAYERYFSAGCLELQFEYASDLPSDSKDEIPVSSRSEIEEDGIDENGVPVELKHLSLTPSFLILPANRTQSLRLFFKPDCYTPPPR